MSELISFLLENPVDNVTEQIKVSDRLQGKLFTIRAMTGAEFSEYQRKATRVSKDKSVDFNTQAFQESVVINHTIEPNFKDADFVKKANCQTPGQLLNKVLLAGEIAELSQQISRLSGFEKTMDETREEAKN